MKAVREIPRAGRKRLIYRQTETQANRQRDRQTENDRIRQMQIKQEIRRKAPIRNRLRS